MVKMVTIEPTPGFRPKEEERAQFSDIKKRGKLRMSYISAIENIRMSHGMYSMAPEKKPEPTVTAARLEDMPIAELKLLMLQTGIKTQKKMARSEIISLIYKKLEEVEITDDE